MGGYLTRLHLLFFCSRLVHVLFFANELKKHGIHLYAFYTTKLDFANPPQIENKQTYDMLFKLVCNTELSA